VAIEAELTSSAGDDTAVTKSENARREMNGIREFMLYWIGQGSNAEFIECANLAAAGEVD
jgi:hypothetical protein